MRKLVIILSVGLAADAASPPSGLPDGPGKATTEKMCTACHGMQNVVKSRRTKERWAIIVDDMFAKGAQGSDDEIEQVIRYLSTNFAARTVNVNKAPAEDMVSAIGISPEDAAMIVSYRTDKGKIKESRDLITIPGINARRLIAASDVIEF